MSKKYDAAIYLDIFHNSAGKTVYRVEKIVALWGFVYHPSGKGFASFRSKDAAVKDAKFAIQESTRRKGPFATVVVEQDFREEKFR